MLGPDRCTFCDGTEGGWPPTKVRYEYAGFLYDIVLDGDGDAVKAIVVPGQHPAAHKNVHREAAVEMFVRERKR